MHHGMMAGPTGIWEYFIAAGAVAIFLVSLYLLIRHFIHPGERSADHIKRRILFDDPPWTSSGRVGSNAKETYGKEFDEKESGDKETRIEVFLDDDPVPYKSFAPPDRFELDATLLEDGPHQLRIVAIDRYGHRGVRKVPFEVRNGPGIAVDGLRENETIEGKINVLVNAYGGAYEEKWEPTRAETPAPVPTWAWVVFILIGAWGMFYGIAQWKPTPQFARTPTYAAITVQKRPTSSEAAMGAELYRTSCASCHQINGQGVQHIFPPLAGDPVVTAADPTEHIKIVLFGVKGKSIGGTAYQAEMPAWAAQLSDEETAAVINHERTSWGNNAPTVTPADVARVRSEGNH